MQSYFHKLGHTVNVVLKKRKPLFKKAKISRKKQCYFNELLMKCSRVAEKHLYIVASLKTGDL